MHTVPLNEARNIPSPSTENRGEAYRTYSEIAARMVDLVDSGGLVQLVGWLNRIQALSLKSQRSLVLYLRLQTGDVSVLACPYSEAGRAAPAGQRSKQAEHQALDDALRPIRSLFPQLANAIDAERERLKH
jgi:hypothetical protein